MGDAGFALDFDPVDAGDRPAVGIGHDRAFGGVEDVKADDGVFRHQRAPPAAGAEGGDRGEGEDFGADGQDRAVGGVIIGGGACRCGNERAVADQFFETGAAIDADPEPRRLGAGAQERDLVDGERFDGGAIVAAGAHAQRVQHLFRGIGQTRIEAIREVFVHQEADRAAIHAVDGCVERLHLVQGLQHEAVATKRDNHIGRLKRRLTVLRGQGREGLLRDGCLAGPKTDGFGHAVPWVDPPTIAANCTKDKWCRPKATRTGSEMPVSLLSQGRVWRYETGKHDLILPRGPRGMNAPHRDTGFFSEKLTTRDPELWAAMQDELGRQRHEIELIASENIVSAAVLEAQGSVLTNKYAEGYPGRRYYGGCQFVDVAETLAIDRATALFGCDFANVQPNSGSQANQGVFQALLQPGDTILGMSLDAGGHLTHGARPNQSGKWFHAVQYGVRQQDLELDYDQVAELAAEHQPKMIIAGGSAIPRLRISRFRSHASKTNQRLCLDNGD